MYDCGRFFNLSVSEILYILKKLKQVDLEFIENVQLGKKILIVSDWVCFIVIGNPSRIILMCLESLKSGKLFYEERVLRKLNIFKK